MESEPDTPVEPPLTPQASVLANLKHARELRQIGKDNLSIIQSVLEEAMSIARANAYEIEFQTRVELALALGDLYVSSDEIDKARKYLNEEAEFTEAVFQVLQATGTTEQKRAAAGGRVQVRDRARQVALLGEPAPELTIKDWIMGEPTTLAELHGRVVLLEFWATWCKPCQAMFPKLKQLAKEYEPQGLEVIALTRHYLARRDAPESEAEELELMRNFIREHDLGFRVGVATDERTQDLYGATGMPALALIDRAGTVRYAHFGGGDDPKFEALLLQCLDEKPPG